MYPAVACRCSPGVDKPLKSRKQRVHFNLGHAIPHIPGAVCQYITIGAGHNGFIKIILRQAPGLTGVSGKGHIIRRNSGRLINLGHVIHQQPHNHHTQYQADEHYPAHGEFQGYRAPYVFQNKFHPHLKKPNQIPERSQEFIYIWGHHRLSPLVFYYLD